MKEVVNQNSSMQRKHEIYFMKKPNDKLAENAVVYEKQIYTVKHGNAALGQNCEHNSKYVIR